MSRNCAHCGTEVEDDALFCPACGQPIDRAEPAVLPPAPDWPEAPPRAAPPASHEGTAPALEPPPSEADANLADEGRATAAAPPSASLRPPTGDAPVVPAAQPPAPLFSPPEVPPWRRGVAARIAPPADPQAPGDSASAAAPSAVARTPDPVPSAPRVARVAPRGPQASVTPPTTLSGWLVGVGSVVGAVALFLPWIVGSGYTERWGLAFGVNVIMLIVLLGIAATIFLARMLPSIPRQSLAIQIVVLVGVGIGLDRALTSFSAIGAIIFLIAMLAAAAGALLPELEMDRAVGGPQA